MRQFWVGLIVVIVALALGVGAAFGASLLVRNRLANLPATSTRLNRNLPSGQPGNNSRRYNNPLMNPGGQQGLRNWGGRGPMMGPGGRGFRNFNNCPVPTPGQTQRQPQNRCLPPGGLNGQATPTPNIPNNGSGNGPF